MSIVRLLLACLVLGGLPGAAPALDLFGVALESSRRDQLREAARAVGLTLVREGGDDNWFDIYDSREALPGSRYCYLGFVKQSQAFAFVEYEFDGLDPKIMLDRLRGRYGEPQVIEGKYLSDRRYAWRRDGIDITLGADWRAYRTRLSYVHPQNMAALRRERAAFVSAREQAQAEGPPLF